MTNFNDGFDTERNHAIMRKAFMESLDDFIAEIDRIDGETRWSVTEPDWWLKMSATRRELRKVRESLEPDYFSE